PKPVLFYHQKSDEEGITFATQAKYKLNAKNLIHAGFSLQLLNYEFIDSLRFLQSYRININRKGNYEIAKSFVQFQHKITDNTQFYTGVSTMYFAFNQSYS
ncbi:MAG TPA: hypothetical protein DCQ31_04695, partial [Bacteroidales bacterium]|nr:hypothetical protein [Bacteroidales bacterium]